MLVTYSKILFTLGCFSPERPNNGDSHFHFCFPSPHPLLVASFFPLYPVLLSIWKVKNGTSSQSIYSWAAWLRSIGHLMTGNFTDLRVLDPIKIFFFLWLPNIWPTLTTVTNCIFLVHQIRSLMMLASHDVSKTLSHHAHGSMQRRTRVAHQFLKWYECPQMLHLVREIVAIVLMSGSS